MKTQLLLHCGGVAATLDDLQAVALPEETQTYKPVSHYDLATHIGRVAKEMLHDARLRDGLYALTKDGGRMFGVHVYETDVQQMGLSIGFRNSYDREFKTASSTPTQNEADASIQLSAYAMAYQFLYDEPPEHLYMVALVKTKTPQNRGA